MLRRERLLLVGAGTVLALIALYLFVFTPKLQERRLARLEQTRGQAEVARLAAVVQRRAVIEREHAAARRSLEDLLDRVPSDPALPALLTQVDFALRASKLQLAEITFPQGTPEAPAASAPPASAPQSPGVGSLALQMQVRGRFPQILLFVQMLETLPRAVSVDSLAITGSDTGTQTSLSIRAFYLR